MSPPRCRAERRNRARHETPRPPPPPSAFSWRRAGKLNWHTLRDTAEQVAAEGPWRDRLAGARDPSPVKPLEFYYDCLARKSRRIVLWETNYIQIMEGSTRSSPGCTAPGCARS